jgi:hypothetical protein
MNKKHECIPIDGGYVVGCVAGSYLGIYLSTLLH